MNLKNKGFVQISQIVLFAAMLALYTAIGGMGMIYVAGSVELFFVITYLFLGGIPDTMEYMIRIRRKRGHYKDAFGVVRAGILYTFMAVVIAELCLFLVNKLVISRTELLYVDKLLYLSMFAVPFLGIMQVLRGILQAEFDKSLTGISKLVFVIFLVTGTVVSGMMLGEYGTKAAMLMQSVGLKHFYVTIGLIPGVVLGALGAIIFLAVIWIIYRKKVTLFEFQPDTPKEHPGQQLWELCTSQFAEVMHICLKHIPVMVLLWLSLGEIRGGNYLFGNFYGAVLPLFGIVWTVFDLGLIKRKKDLFLSYRRKMEEQYYKELKSVLSYVLLVSVGVAVFTLALHKSYLAIWDLQNFVSFMKLMRFSALIGMLGLPYMVFLDVLKYRNMRSEAVVSVFAGAVAGVIGSIVCSNASGAGMSMYVWGIFLQLFVTVITAAWYVSRSVGIHYMSVIVRTGVPIVFICILGIALFGLQQLIFTAMGGLGTLIICVAIACVAGKIIMLVLNKSGIFF